MKKTNVAEVADSTIHLLHRASQIAEKLFEATAASGGLTARQFLVLAMVADGHNPSQIEISDKTGIDRSTLADLVGRMVSRGLLTRSRTRTDARRYDVRVTDAGRKLLEDVISPARFVDEQLLKPLSADQRRDFQAALRRITEVSEVTAAD